MKYEPGYLTDNVWNCDECGASNAAYRTTCGRCEEVEERKRNNPKKKLLEILQTLKEDFEMLEDGTWDLNYSDGSEIRASLDNVEKAIELVNSNFYE